MTIHRIVVGVDGSPNSLTAVHWAATLAASSGAVVVAVHALGLLERFDSQDPVPTRPHRDEIRRRFETTWCAPLDRLDQRSRRIVRDGDPISVLLAVADEEDADLIVMGTRGVGAYPTQLMGSTSTQVAQRSHRPVAIVPTT